MEHESQTEPIEPPVERGISPEEETRSLGSLPETLGFTETEELRQLRNEWVEAMTGGADTAALAARYQSLAEVVVNQREGADFARAQIALSIRVALIRRDGGREDACLADLEDALVYAENMGYQEIAETLQAAIDRVG